MTRTRWVVMLLTAAAATACTRMDTQKSGTGPGAQPGRTPLKLPTGIYYSYELSKSGRLAFSKFVDGKAAIFVADGDGNNARRVSFGVWDTGPLWSPDGKLIAFNRWEGTEADVVIVPADSGAEHVVDPTAASEFPNAWLPDGTGLVFERYTGGVGEPWLYHLADSKTAKLFEVNGSAVAFPSPDGASMAYSLSKEGKATLWMWDRAKNTHRQLTTDGFESIGYDCFSPDGRSILYQSTRTGTADLWRLDVATGERRQLTQDVADDFGGHWSPDGTRVVFSSNRGGQYDLWTLTTGESDVQRLTNDGLIEGGSAWTLDGLGVLSLIPGGHTHLYAVSTAGAPPVPLTSGDWDVAGPEPALSPDGSQVAYAGTRNGDFDIWVVPTAGGDPRLVSGAPGADVLPGWSPDGKQIAFISNRGGTADLWVVPSTGGAATRLLDWPSAESMPRWSPDGKRVAFSSNHDSPGVDLWVIPSSGGAPTRLTRTGTVSLDFRWSPDSKTLAVSMGKKGSGATSTFLVSADGGQSRELAPPDHEAPFWAPDGRTLALNSCAKGYCRVETWSADGALIRHLSEGDSLYEYPGHWSPDGTQLVVGWQELKGDGGYRIDLRPATGGAAHTLVTLPGYDMFAAGFASAGKVVIAVGRPSGNVIQRIDVPPVPAKK